MSRRIDLTHPAFLVLVLMLFLAGAAYGIFSWIVGLGEAATQQREARLSAEALIKRPVISGNIVEVCSLPKDISGERKLRYPFWFKMNIPEQGQVTFFFDTSGGYSYDEWSKFERHQELNNSTNYARQATNLGEFIVVGNKITIKTFESDGIKRQVYDIIKLEPKGSLSPAKENSAEALAHAKAHAKTLAELTTSLEHKPLTLEQQARLLKELQQAWQVQVKLLDKNASPDSDSAANFWLLGR